MIVKLLTEHHLEFLSLKTAEARPSLHMSKCLIVGNLMHWLILYFLISFYSKVYAAVTLWKCPNEMLPLSITSYVFLEKQENNCMLD